MILAQLSPVTNCCIIAGLIVAVYAACRWALTRHG